jgi:5-methylcytosine-specific restriction endonuclease McrA
VNRFSLTHLSNEVLRSELTTKAVREKEATAELLAQIAEFDERKPYLPAAYESMLAYCIGELHLSEEAAKKRVWVARAARKCPGVFETLASGRVHLAGLVVLARHLSPQNAPELLAAAEHKSRAEIERLVVKRFPRLGVPAQVTPNPGETTAGDPGQGSPGNVGNTVSQAVTGADTPPARSCDRVTALSADGFAVQFTRSGEADERFRYAQTLLGSRVNAGDLAEVYSRAIEALIERLERVRFGACAHPRKSARRTRSGSRHIANDVKRAVWIRDQGQCTYESESGRRCEARADLQFDHEKEFARGGEATVDNIRLRCPGHNQHAAEQTYGAGFVKQKRQEAARARAAAKAAKERANAEKAKAAEAAQLEPHQLEVIPWLLELGFSKADSRIAVERCRDMADAPLEERVRGALSWFGARLARTVSYAPAP